MEQCVAQSSCLWLTVVTTKLYWITAPPGVHKEQPSDTRSILTTVLSPLETNLIETPTFLPTGYVTVGKDIYGSQFLHLWNEDNTASYLLALFWGSNAACLAMRVCHVPANTALVIYARGKLPCTFSLAPFLFLCCFLALAMYLRKISICIEKK